VKVEGDVDAQAAHSARLARVREVSRGGTVLGASFLLLIIKMVIFAICGEILSPCMEKVNSWNGYFCQ
jgi:hypothetical protein